jgi:asparagine synthetase B (glutamine-hydrolysing)
MKLETSYQTAKELAHQSKPVFYAHFAAPLLRGTGAPDAPYVVGRKYRGLFDDNDGSYVTVTRAASADTLVDRDSYGAIPLFYSTNRPIVSTDIRLLIEIEKPDLDVSAVAEYLSASYLTGGKTIYRNVRSLMPDETIVVRDNVVVTSRKKIFPGVVKVAEATTQKLLESAIDNSISDLLTRYPGTIALNLSGGADSTLLLAKIRTNDRKKEIQTTTYFHGDWRDDLNDWEYASEAAEKFSSHHRLLKIDNESFCLAHKELMSLAKNVFHTYAAAFYAQNKLIVSAARDVPIVNGSGPDESIIGSEKISISELLSLRSLKREEWLDYLINNIDYLKLTEASVGEMLHGVGGGVVDARKAVAARLMDAPNFVELQRRYHAITVLQDHILELTSAAQALDRTILFPYLTNDIFRIVFSTPFETLNSSEVYKSVVKEILGKFMPRSFTHRKKIGFQSPSRPYFRTSLGFGRELPRLLSQSGAGLLNLEQVEPAIRQRLSRDIDLQRRYDFLEWTVYNLLLLEEFRGRS